MSPRSLIASERGVQKAKRALTRLQLTQKAIAEELCIASWSTVSKFFNRKSVDRSIFQEICRALDLEWQEIATMPAEEEREVVPPEPPPEPDLPRPAPPDRLLDAVKRSAARARKALDPYILPPIRRQGVLDKCLSQISRGLAGKQRVVPILGAAGYGKSTLLGTLYDELCQNAGVGWIALARCDDLVAAPEHFPAELGEKVSDRPLSMVEVAQQLAAQSGPGVLLLDTLDIVLAKPLVPVFRLLLSQLLECGTTIAFTCRDTDYADFFEPYHESFAGFREKVYEGCKIGQFDESDVAQAARGFAACLPEYPTPESQEAFAQRIFALSADSVSLAEIVRNPLLLALLCELFAEAQVVPEDLTVSQLYEIYWNWKIAKARHQQDSPRIGKIKEKLCLHLAEVLYRDSGERLRDFVYETSLDLQGETEFAAYSALRSDGVLKEFGHHRIGFFHQTFLEYAIARWLNATPSGDREQSQIRDRLCTLDSRRLPHYLWPILRQHLTLVALPIFYDLCEAIDTGQLLPFRTLAFAGVSRAEPEAARVLWRLCDVAVEREYGFLEALLVAANSAPNRHGETMWQVVVRSLGCVGPELINKTIEITADFIERSAGEAQRFHQAVRALTNNKLMQDSVEKQHQLWGKFLSAYRRHLRQKDRSIDEEILRFFQQQYASFGSRLRQRVIELYLTPTVPKALRREFLLAIVPLSPANNSFFEKENAVELLEKVLPELLTTGETIFGQSWLQVLDAPLQREWMSVAAAVVGKKAAQNAELGERMTAALFDAESGCGGKSFNRSSAIALQETIQCGGGNRVAAALLKRDIERIPPSRMSTLGLVLRTLAESTEAAGGIDAEMAQNLGQWVTPMVWQYPVELIRVMDELGMRSAKVREQLAELLPPI